MAILAKSPVATGLWNSDGQVPRHRAYHHEHNDGHGERPTSGDFCNSLTSLQHWKNQSPGATITRAFSPQIEVTTSVIITADSLAQSRGPEFRIFLKKKRLTLDLDPTFQRRLKAIAALKGVSMRRYCQAAIDRELTRDEANGMAGLLSDKPDHELFAELRQEIFGGKPLPGSSADLIREAREIRDAETEGWA